ncbi:hypothetical protein J3F83DRAFT_712396 [Trichoderma novae-zelandiae]
MSAPKTPHGLIWLKVFVRSNLHQVSRRIRHDESEVRCVEDHAVPPPPYQRVWKSPPVEGEVFRLRRVQFSCHERLKAVVRDGPERRRLLEDAEMLKRWIEHLEDLLAEHVGRTVPARFRREPYRERIKRRIKNRGRGKEEAAPPAA